MMVFCIAAPQGAIGVSNAAWRVVTAGAQGRRPPQQRPHRQVGPILRGALLACSPLDCLYVRSRIILWQVNKLTMLSLHPAAVCTGGPHRADAHD